MTTLNDYLVEKRVAVRARRARLEAGEAEPHELRAQVRAEGRSGVRRIRIRDFQVISDSGPDFAGYNLGPSSPELQLGVLGSCLTHVFLIHAADRGVPLDSLEVEVSGRMDPRAGRPGFEDVPIYPHDIRYSVHITSPAAVEELTALHAVVERACPILNLLQQPQQIYGVLHHTVPAEAVEVEAVAG
ncbi:MAG: OsmC family protein [Chloroflexaceae bacterium]|nr:OsmC family protein [Chloroflexaceae bacterium]